MVLCECACANLISKANFNLINRTDLFICLRIMFQLLFQNSKGQKSYHKFLGVRSELLLSICENKGAVQLRGNHAADQHLCFLYVDSTIHLFLKSKISGC